MNKIRQVYKLCDFIQQSILKTRIVCLSSTNHVNQLCFVTDRYNGITVDLGQIDINTTNEDDFNSMLSESVKTWKHENRTAAWLSVPITHSKLILAASHHGFTFHHAEGNHAMMQLWLQTDQIDPTPIFASHQVGVSGFVLNEKTNEVLVVQDKNRPHTLWKFPGGLSDLGEDIGATAVREVLEETGIETEFKSVLSFRQQHNQPGAFGRSDFYVICRLRPKTFHIRACSVEIRQCKWMHIEDLKQEIQASSITKRLTDLAEFGLKEGWDKVDIGCEEMKSIYKGYKFKLYHRPFKQIN